ncbi:unnamed protein product [Paramecium octaurelia]|uniref:Uncharacterized protein n=1 Tax=Paramecium octaurelia TaxID=43137 RepID=A0A8S1TY37_PAROT|nr:unnamed protein product [Paramecium octaurelia]
MKKILLLYSEIIFTESILFAAFNTVSQIEGLIQKLNHFYFPPNQLCYQLYNNRHNISIIIFYFNNYHFVYSSLQIKIFFQAFYLTSILYNSIRNHYKNQSCGQQIETQNKKTIKLRIPSIYLLIQIY